MTGLRLRPPGAWLRARGKEGASHRHRIGKLAAAWSVDQETQALIDGLAMYPGCGIDFVRSVAEGTAIQAESHSDSHVACSRRCWPMQKLRCRPRDRTVGSRGRGRRDRDR